MTRYTHELRFRFKGDVTLAQRYIPQARVVLGKMLETHGPGVTTGTMTRQIAPGVVVRASVWDGMPIAEIDVTQAAATPQTVPTEFNPWVPEGFVFYPASDTSPNGWGLPLQLVEVDDVPADEQVFAAENLAPGLDVARWTPGGALGEVLVTRKPDAGYPPLSTNAKQSTAYPPLYHPDYGPHPESKSPVQYSAWQAYRLEFVDFDANVDGLSADERAARKGWKREMFRLFNEHRVDIGRDAINPPIRGDYDSAQATCEWTAATGWWGHSCAGYPPTWRPAAERAMKNGTQASHYAPANDASMGVHERSGAMADEILVWSGASLDVQYADQNGWDVGIINAPVPHSPSLAMSEWLSSPPHKDIIENTKFDASPLWGSWLQIGVANGVSAAHFNFRQQWIQCGNRYWHSAHPEVPTLSWFGPTSKNLYDDFWPVTFSIEGDGDGNIRANIVGGTRPLTNPDGEGNVSSRFWQRLHNTGDATYPTLNQGMLGPYIFARGRTIAIAPDAGFVLAAAMYKHGDYDVQYRLLALCLHESDDPGDVWQGYTPKVRLWWVDLPRHVVETFNGVPTSWIAGNPHTVIREKYGAEEDTWPWVEKNSPYSWRGGEAIDVNSSGLGRPPGDMLSYASLWEFNREGTKAVCLRYSYDKAMFDWAPSRWWGNPSATVGRQTTWTDNVLCQSPAWVDQACSGLSTVSIHGDIYYDGLHICGTPVFCELTLAPTLAETTATLSTWTHNPAGGFVPNVERLLPTDLDAIHWYFNEAPVTNASTAYPLVEMYQPGRYWERAARVIPLYAFYASDGQVRAVYDVVTNMSGTFKEQWDWGNWEGHSQVRYLWNLAPGVFYRGVSVGPSIVSSGQCFELVASATQYSSEIGCNGVTTVADYPVVLHASDKHLAFAALGVDCPLVVTDGAPGGFPFNLQPREIPIDQVHAHDHPDDGIEVAGNPDWNPSDVVETARHVVQMDVYLDGSRIHSSRHPNPNKFHLHRAWNGPWDDAGTGFYTDLLAFYFVEGYTKLSFNPRWNTAWGLIGGFVEDRVGNWAVCATYGVQVGTAFYRTNDSYYFDPPAGRQYVFIYPGMATTTNQSGPYNAGGFMASSFATQEELAAMMNIPGDNPRSHYVRVV